MGQGRFRLVLLCAAILGAAALTGPAGAATDCSTRLLADWEDGRIDRTYAIPCYRDALASLPEDLKVYSTAESDLTRALQAELASPRAKAAGGVGENDGVSPLLVLVISGGILLAAGSLAVITR
jgi:hypothetical protein